MLVQMTPHFHTSWHPASLSGILVKRFTVQEKEKKESLKNVGKWPNTMAGRHLRCEMMRGDGDNAMGDLGKVTGGAVRGTDL